MVIRNGFIRSEEGPWFNLDRIGAISIEYVDANFVINCLYEKMKITLSDGYDSFDEAQEELDELMGV